MPIVRARDVRANIKDYGFEQGVVTTLEQFLDEFAEYRQHQRELVELVNKCVDQLAIFNAINDGMIREIDRIKRERIDGTEEC